MVAEDDHTVRVELKKPQAGWLIYLTKYFGLIPAGHDFDALFSEVQGSGPYRVTHFETDVVVELEANPDYYLGEAPQKKIRIVRIADDATQLAHLRTGEVDIIGTCPPKDFASTIAEPEFTGEAIPSAGIFYAPFNRQKPPFDNIHFRRAVANAVNRDFICNGIYFGLVTPTSIPAAPSEYWYDEELAKELAYDPDKAKWHLKQAGVSGFSFTATIPVPSAYIEARDASLIIQANLAEVGIEMRIRQMDFGSMYGGRVGRGLRDVPAPLDAAFHRGLPLRPVLHVHCRQAVHLPALQRGVRRERAQGLRDPGPGYAQARPAGGVAPPGGGLHEPVDRPAQHLPCLAARR